MRTRAGCAIAQANFANRSAVRSFGKMTVESSQQGFVFRVAILGLHALYIVHLRLTISVKLKQIKVLPICVGWLGSVGGLNPQVSTAYGAPVCDGVVGWDVRFLGVEFGGICRIFWGIGWGFGVGLRKNWGLTNERSVIC